MGTRPWKGEEHMLSLEGIGWTLPGGEEYYPFSNLHCMVLTGYEGDTFTLMDPIEGTVTVDREQFMSRYWTTGERAVAFGEDSQ